MARHGWRLLPYYAYDAASGVWRFQGRETALAADIDSLDLDSLCRGSWETAPVLALAGQAAQAERELCRLRPEAERYSLTFDDDAERLRWFVLPQEVAAELDALEAGAVAEAG